MLVKSLGPLGYALLSAYDAGVQRAPLKRGDSGDVMSFEPLDMHGQKQTNNLLPILLPFPFNQPSHSDPDVTFANSTDVLKGMYMEAMKIGSYLYENDGAGACNTISGPGIKADGSGNLVIGQRSYCNLTIADDLFDNSNRFVYPRGYYTGNPSEHLANPMDNFKYFNGHFVPVLPMAATATNWSRLAYMRPSLDGKDYYHDDKKKVEGQPLFNQKGVSMQTSVTFPEEIPGYGTNQVQCNDQNLLNFTYAISQQKACGKNLDGSDASAQEQKLCQLDPNSAAESDKQVPYVVSAFHACFYDYRYRSLDKIDADQKNSGLLRAQGGWHNDGTVETSMQSVEVKDYNGIPYVIVSAVNDPDHPVLDESGKPVLGIDYMKTLYRLYSGSNASWLKTNGDDLLDFKSDPSKEGFSNQIGIAAFALEAHNVSGCFVGGSHAGALNCQVSEPYNIMDLSKATTAKGVADKWRQEDPMYQDGQAAHYESQIKQVRDTYNHIWQQFKDDKQGMK